LSEVQLAQLAQVVEAGPDREKDGVVRWWRVDLKRVIAERFGDRLSSLRHPSLGLPRRRDRNLGPLLRVNRRTSRPGEVKKVLLDRQKKAFKRSLKRASTAYFYSPAGRRKARRLAGISEAARHQK
jgi:hypothetical protein